MHTVALLDVVRASTVEPVIGGIVAQEEVGSGLPVGLKRCT
jgi:hypothetical protein